MLVVVGFKEFHKLSVADVVGFVVVVVLGRGLLSHFVLFLISIRNIPTITVHKYITNQHTLS